VKIRNFGVLSLALIFLAGAAGLARANVIDSAGATLVCGPSTGGSLAVTGEKLETTFPLISTVIHSIITSI
jgi:hypothetical protein